MNLEPYKEWIQKLEYNKSKMMWEARVFPDYIFFAYEYPALFLMIQKVITHEVASLVCEGLNTPIEPVFRKFNGRENTDARSVIAYILKNKLHMNLQTIAEMFNKTNHTTALHAIKKVKRTNEVHEKLLKVQRLYDILKF